MDLPLTPAVVGGTSSTLGAAFNILCTVVGTGLLNLPAGFAQSGWVGAPMLVIMCTMAGYTACVLIKCFKYIGGKGSVTGELQNVLMDDVVGSSGSAETYGDIGEAAFGAFGRWFVVVQMHLTLCMVGTIYHLLAAINLISLVPHLSQPIAVLIVTAVVFGHVLLKTLSEVAAVSYVNITINAVLTVVVITSALTNPPSEAPTTTFAVSDPLSLGKAFASFGFAFGVHPVLPSVYRSMRYPQSYTRMVIAAFTCVMLFYLPMGIIGYATYGEVVKSPIYETGELAKTVATKVAIGLITSHLIMSYPIVLNPPERALETTLEPLVPLPPLVLRVLLRCGFMAMTGVIAAVLTPPQFGSFLDLVSAFTSTFTVFILPCLFYLKLRGGPWSSPPRYINPLEIAWNGLILIFSIVGATFGTVGAIQELISLAHPADPPAGNTTAMA